MRLLYNESIVILSRGAKTTMLLTAVNRKERKHFFFPHIVNLIKNANKPVLHIHEIGDLRDRYFILGNLPEGRQAIYTSDTVSVIDGWGPLGFPIYDSCGTYRPHSEVRTFGRDGSFSERDLVVAVRMLVSNYYGVRH
jgi:hypothetical protein